MKNDVTSFEKWQSKVQTKFFTSARNLSVCVVVVSSFKVKSLLTASKLFTCSVAVPKRFLYSLTLEWSFSISASNSWMRDLDSFEAVCNCLDNDS